MINGRELKLRFINGKLQEYKAGFPHGFNWTDIDLNCLIDNILP